MGSQLAWEQKLTAQVLKSLSINAFLVGRMYKRRDLVDSTEAFRSLETYRSALNRVQSTAGFMFDASLELLSHAKLLHCDALVGGNEDQVTVCDEKELIQKAGRKKRQRFDFFNLESGVCLRLNVSGHIPTHGVKRY